MNVYDFTVKNNVGEEVSLADYKGKVLLIVNTATMCGLTPQYEQLQALYDRFGNEKFEILDFPCNQFKNQAPGSDEEIESFCQLNYNTTFPRFAKVEINGANAAPLYVWLKEQAPTETTDADAQKFAELIASFITDLGPSDITWNFGKFLIDSSGEVAIRYAPGIAPEKIAEKVEELIG